jgi:hypothetical protein
MKNIFKYCLVLSLFLTNFSAFAQLGDPNEGEDPQPTAAPINTKLILLTIVGVLFVLYSLRQNKKTI